MHDVAFCEIQTHYFALVRVDCYMQVIHHTDLIYEHGLHNTSGIHINVEEVKVD